MKILVISFFYYPDLSAGSFRTKALTDKLLEHKKIDSIDVVTTYPNRYKNFKNEPIKTINNIKLNIHRIRVPKLGSGQIQQSLIYLFFLIKAVIYTRGKNYDVIYATSAKLLTAVLGAIISMYKKKPLYIDFRDIFLDAYIDTGNKIISFIFIPIINQLEKFAITRANKINLVSEGFYNYFYYKYPNKKYSFFTNGIDQDFINNNIFKNNMINSKKIEKRLTVLYAGNIGVGQGLEKIIPQISKKLEDKIIFKIIGSGSLASQLELKIKESKCSNILLLAPIGRDKMINEYINADILFLHLNDYDAYKKVLPSKIFEYAATGKPIWAGVDGYAKKFLSEEVIGSWIFEPSNINSAIKSFKLIKNDWSDRQVFIKKYNRNIIQKNLVDDILSIVKTVK
tara:strand:+ start:83 stop:1273 length:1191 start_codon:yes stop_codon:yes gene_type:complete